MANMWLHVVVILLIQKTILTLSQPQFPNYYPNNNNDPNQQNGFGLPNSVNDRPKNDRNRGRNRDNFGQYGHNRNRHGSVRHTSRKHDNYNGRFGPPGNQSPWNQNQYIPNYYQRPYEHYMPQLNCTEKLSRRNCVQLNGVCATNNECCTWICKESKCRPSRTGPCIRDDECNTEICLKKLDVCKCTCANFGRKCIDHEDCCFGVCNPKPKSDGRMICVCKKNDEKCETENDCCGENAICTNGICKDNTNETALEKTTSNSSYETSPEPENEITNQMTTKLEPEINNKMESGNGNKLKLDMSTTLEPETTTEMESDTNSNITTKIKSIMANKIEPKMTTKMGLKVRSSTINPNKK